MYVYWCWEFFSYQHFPHATFARNCHILLLVSVEVCVDIIHCKFHITLSKYCCVMTTISIFLLYVLHWVLHIFLLAWPSNYCKTPCFHSLSRTHSHQTAAITNVCIKLPTTLHLWHPCYHCMYHCMHFAIERGPVRTTAAVHVCWSWPASNCNFCWFFTFCFPLPFTH